MMKRIFTTGAALLTLTAALHAELKIAVVDFSRAEQEYNKTKEVQSALTDRRNSIQKEMQEMQDDLNKASDEINKLKEAVQDKTLSDSARADKQKALDVKISDASLQYRKLQEYGATRQQMFKEEAGRMFQGLNDDLSNAIAAEGKKGGYTLVLDKSAQSIAQVNIILYTQDLKDITDDVIKAVNAKSPASSAAQAPSAPSH